MFLVRGHFLIKAQRQSPVDSEKAMLGVSVGKIAPGKISLKIMCKIMLFERRE